MRVTKIIQWCFSFSIVLLLSACAGPEGEIEGVAYNQGTGSDYVPRMFILFKNGDLCTDTYIVATDLSIAEHKQKYPESWSTWKWQDGVLVYMTSSGWRRFDYNKISPPFPADTTFNNVYKNTVFSGGVGNGTGASSSYSFFENGRFVNGFTVNSVVSNGDGSVTGIADDMQGAYEIDGLRLTLSYDNGHVWKNSIIAENMEDIRHIYIGGRIYIRR